MLRKTVLSAMLAACIVALPISCVTCPPPTDTPTCDVQNAIAIGGLVDTGAQALMAAVPILPPSIIAAIAAYHLAYPLAVQAAQAALAEYEATHSGLWSAAVAGLTSLYTALDKLITAFGQPSLVTAAKAQVKAEGASQVIHELHMKGVLK
jgi:hypothetical protein